MLRAGYGSKKKSNFTSSFKKHYQNEPRFRVFSGKNLPKKIK